MAHFAEINENNTVLRVIVAEQDFINTGALGDPSRWIQTSYNTAGNQHALNGTPFRKNFAGPGFTYDAVRDAFIEPKPMGTYVLDEETCTWSRPKPYPADKTDPNAVMYTWNEEQQNWIETTDPLLMGR